MMVPVRLPGRGRAWIAGVTLLAVLLTACGGSSPASTPASKVPGSPVATAAPSSARNLDKVDEVFLRLLLVYQSQGLDAARQFARDQGLMTTKEEVRITLVLDSDDPMVVDGTALSVGRLGGRVTATFGNQIEMVVPAQTLVEYGKGTNKPNFFADLADFAHVKDIRRTPLAHPAATPVPRPRPTQAVAPGATGAKSEGVALTNAAVWQAAGITGKGVKVGVIDAGFNKYQQVLGGATVTAKSLRLDGLIEDRSDDETIHGTACAEIVHEMAPDAELYLVAVGTPGEFVAGVTYLVGAGVSVISSSLGFDGYNPTDGTSALALAADTARTAGVFFVNAAGNSASGTIGTDSVEGHFSATFQDGDGDSFHDFPGAKKENGLTVRLGADPFAITLNWDDWKEPYRTNYALFLYNRAGQEVARSDTDHVRRGKRPVQELRGKTAAGMYTLKIRKVRPDDPDLRFNIYFNAAQLEQTTAAGSLTIPADARGVVAIGAVDVRTDTVEDFSSRGPTLDGRVKPDLGGPDNVSSIAYALVGEGSFFGTSAATPHVGGAAALLLQAFPGAQPDGMLQYFLTHARQPKGAQGGGNDNIIGGGRLFLDVVPTNASVAPAPTRAATGTVTPTPAPAPATRLTASFADDFSSPSSGLPALGYAGGAYHIAADATTLVPALYGRDVSARRAVYEVQARKTSGADDAMMGLVVRYLDRNNYLAFIITNDGSFGVFAKVGGGVQQIGTMQQNAAIKPNEPNTIRVEVQDATFRFSANGLPLMAVEITNIWPTGAFGLIGGGGVRTLAEVTFTQLAVMLPG